MECEWSLGSQSRHSVEDYLDDRLRCGRHRRVVHILRADTRAHTGRHNGPSRKEGGPISAPCSSLTTMRTAG